MSSKDFDESIESIDRRIAQLRARRRDEVARHEKRERNARAFACMVLGCRLVDWAGDWHGIDPGRVDALLADVDPQVVADGAEESLSTTQALRRLHEWERDREADADARDEAAEADELGSVGEHGE
jgi:hypothetical protein